MKKVWIYKYFLGAVLVVALMLALQTILNIFASDKIAGSEFAGHDNPEKYAEYFNGISTPIGKSTTGYKISYRTDEFNKAFDMAIKGCHIVSDIQKKAIINKYKSVLEED